MPQEVLDLDGDVIRKRRVRRVKGVHDTRRVGWAIEEIGIAKCDVLGPSRNERLDIGHDNAGRYYSELPFVNRHDGTVPAHVLTTAARLSRSDDLPRSIRHLQRGVTVKGRQTVTVWNKKIETRHIPPRVPFIASASDFRWFTMAAADTSFYSACDQRQVRLKFTAEHLVDADRSKPVGIEGRIQAERTNPSRRIQSPDDRNRRSRETRCGVHGEVKPDQRSAFDKRLAQALFGKVEQRDLPSRFSQPGSWRRETEGLY